MAWTTDAADKYASTRKRYEKQHTRILKEEISPSAGIWWQIYSQEMNPMTEKVERLMPVAKGRYANPQEMVRDLSDDKEQAERTIRIIQERTIIDHLMAMRSSLDMSQHDLAAKMKCTQSRISKLENGKDDDLTIGAFRDYARALGLNMCIQLYRDTPKIADQIRYHALSIEKLFKQIAKVAKDDHAITQGVMKLFEATARQFAEIATVIAQDLKSQEPTSIIRVESEGCTEIEMTETSPTSLLLPAVHPVTRPSRSASPTTCPVSSTRSMNSGSRRSSGTTPTAKERF